MANPTPFPWRGRLLVLAGITLAAFNLRTAITSLTPLLEIVGGDLGFGSGTAGVLGMLPTAAFAVLGVATPPIVHRLGLERTVVLAMSLAAAGVLARGLVGGTAGLILASLVALAGMGIGNVVLPPLVKRYFFDRVGTVSSVYLTSLQLGTMAPAFFAVPLTLALGWRLSLAAWVVPAALAALPWLWVLRGGRPALARQTPGNTAELPRATPPAGAKVWRAPLAWSMVALLGMTSLVTYALFTWIPRWMSDAGLDPTAAGAMLGVYSAAGLVTSLAVPVLAARMRQPFQLIPPMLAGYAIGFAGLLWAPGTLPGLWPALLGLAGGSFPLALTLVNMRTRTPAGSAGLSGFIHAAGYLLACAGPLAVGWLRDSTGGWGWPVVFLAGCLAVLAWGGWTSCRPRFLEDEWCVGPVRG
ncbi:MFS transporter [Lysobacter sp. GX 14042]|uniref:MFS transporter n=1 Tax=Lysobacter sp. GX 14042 TaxID=2907155 RepID=UPI001F4148B0|nr:MFS transporter [Lysobacter sp. GX 14042]MCE7032613.1 MFS transporter [Lysobacter sp. GX 14042]